MFAQVNQLPNAFIHDLKNKKQQQKTIISNVSQLGQRAPCWNVWVCMYMWREACIKLPAFLPCRTGNCRKAIIILNNNNNNNILLIPQQIFLNFPLLASVCVFIYFEECRCRRMSPCHPSSFCKGKEHLCWLWGRVRQSGLFSKYLRNKAFLLPAGNKRLINIEKVKNDYSHFTFLGPTIKSVWTDILWKFCLTRKWSCEEAEKGGGHCREWELGDEFGLPPSSGLLFFSAHIFSLCISLLLPLLASIYCT